MKIKNLLAFIPALIGLIAALVLNLTQIYNPIAYLRADMGTLSLLAGLLISGLIFLGIRVSQAIETTERETAQRAIQDRRRFLRLLDHELKNPLTAIMAGLANLANGQSEEQHYSSLESVESQVQRLSSLMTDLRKLSDLETRQLELSPVNLGEVLKEVYEVVQQDKKMADRQFNLALPLAPWPLSEIVADRDLLFLAVHNLVDNAVKFTQPGDTIELRASDDEKNITIEVADTGPGIPEEEIDLVWTELYRGKQARGIPGSGLGLALVQAIIARHQGGVAIRSRSGQGTVITLHLPIESVTKL